MVLRDELNRFLARLYNFDNFDDYCVNGLQVEGKEEINKILFGVSFNLRLLERAIEQKVDAIIVHHPIFDKGFFILKGHKKKKIKLLLDYDISLFGVHLPMDAHPRLGHNALLLSAVEAGNIEPFDVGFSGENVKQFSLDQIINIFYDKLQRGAFPESGKEAPLFSLSQSKGFTILRNGPEVPKKISVITGASSDSYEKAVEAGVDTFICGEIREHIPALSYETGTNYIDLGHYYSEKPGVLALMEHIGKNFAVETAYVEIPNPI